MYDILIIGSGVVGANIARRLSMYNFKIGILEKENDICMGTSKANSAIVHGGYAEDSNTLKGKICYSGRQQFRQLNNELNFGYKQIGSIVLAEKEEDIKILKELKENGEKNGLEDLQILNSDEIYKIEPNINRNFKYGLYCKGAGVCSPFEFTIALIENAINNGVELFLNEEVLNIDSYEDKFIVNTKSNKFSSKIVINCAGLYSEKIANMVGDNSFKIKYRSGQYFVFDKTEGNKINNVLFQMPSELGKGILISKTIYNNLIIGPDAINEEKMDFTTSIERLEEIFNKSRLITTDINTNKIIRTFAGVRAVSESDDFIIEKSNVGNFINVAGIQSPGLTSSPAIADYVLEIIKNMNIELSKKNDFNPFRKGYGNYEEKDYSKDELICICEEKNEEDIMECFKRNIPINTIDAIKRRVRAGMGQCQGRRCKKKIEKILIEKNIDIDYRTDIEIKSISRVDRFELIKKLNQSKDNI